jgi:multiple sugar transport system ATP-binding protein
MNLLPVEVTGPGLLLLEGRRFPVEGPMADLLGDWIGHHITGGLRPEHLRLAPATNRNLAAEVTHCEALGNEQLITCRLLEGSHLVLVRAEPDQSLTVGQTVHLDVEPTGWRLFDGLGAALLPQEAAARPRPEPQLPTIGH